MMPIDAAMFARLCDTHRIRRRGSGSDVHAYAHRRRNAQDSLWPSWGGWIGVTIARRSPRATRKDVEALVGMGAIIRQDGGHEVNLALPPASLPGAAKLLGMVKKEPRPGQAPPRTR